LASGWRLGLELSSFASDRERLDAPCSARAAREARRKLFVRPAATPRRAATYHLVRLPRPNRCADFVSVYPSRTGRRRLLTPRRKNCVPPPRAPVDELEIVGVSFAAATPMPELRSRPAADLAAIAASSWGADDRDGKVVWRFRTPPSGMAPPRRHASGCHRQRDRLPLYGDPRPIHPAPIGSALAKRGHRT
jgi:hypothetical protein